MKVAITVDRQATDNLIKRLRAQQSFIGGGPEMRAALYSAGNLLRNAVTLSIRSSGLQVRTGMLLNSVNFEVGETDGKPYVAVSIDGVKYARTHEYGTKGAGGTLPDIVPKQGRFLTIPASREYERVTARQIFDRLQFVAKGDGITGARFMDTSKSPAVVAYWLKRKVAIPPRPFFMRAIMASLDRVQEILNKGMEK